MDKITYLKKFSIQPKINEKTVLADEIWRYFNKELEFPRIMRMITEKGVIFVRQTFLELKKTECKDRLALFIYKIKECKIQGL